MFLLQIRPADAGEIKPIVLKYSVTFPATGTQADGAKKLGELIKECSDGRMVMEFYPSSQLGDKIASMEGLIAGTLEMTETAATDLSNYSPVWSVLSLPYLWDNPKQAIGTLTDLEVRAVLEADAADLGFIVISWCNLGSRSVLNTQRPVNTPADMKGMRIRVMEDPVLAGTLNAMGGSATPMPWSEVYTALQQGTIQGLENSAPVILANGMEEVAKFYSLTEQFMIPDPTFVSKLFFNRLSRENQEALLEAGRKFSDAWNNDIWANAMARAMNTMREKGVRINEVDKPAFVKAVRPVIDGFLKSADKEQKKLYDLLIKVRVKY
ncbi:MAG: TRAP transporter substrate-binding protein [Planctomycetota bacterium]|jgi:tripartite ATP-independent transporter DctP family solute receptor|nr:TRAP transporter substrate-binding protein [Planctomycetota bacterium]